MLNRWSSLTRITAIAAAALRGAIPTTSTFLFVLVCGFCVSNHDRARDAQVTNDGFNLLRLFHVRMLA